MYCKKCGAQNPDDAKYCSNCGALLSEDKIFEVQKFKYAGFWRRFAAILIDSFILGFSSGFILSLITYPTILQFSILNTFISWLYFTIFESSSKQATLGKMALRIKVTDLEGKPISFARANGRYWSKILSGMLFAIGYLMAGFTKKKQALHDIIANTLVIKIE